MYTIRKTWLKGWWMAVLLSLLIVISVLLSTFRIRYMTQEAPKHLIKQIGDTMGAGDKNRIPAYEDAQSAGLTPRHAKFHTTSNVLQEPHPDNGPKSRERYELFRAYHNGPCLPYENELLFRLALMSTLVFLGVAVCFRDACFSCVRRQSHRPPRNKETPYDKAVMKFLPKMYGGQVEITPGDVEAAAKDQVEITTDVFVAAAKNGGVGREAMNPLQEAQRGQAETTADISAAAASSWRSGKEVNPHYHQKRRLEKNWNLGRYTNFSLPHPDFANESHTEWVYTLQYSGNYLVSGSKDRSVRIWNLETQRLALPPLIGHSASVLCLQFDPRQEQDIIISSGSDCHVILWKFSTGDLIQKLEQAHAESVLNLRFNDNYLITCSKDRTIKVWNRRELMPTDSAYPKPTVSNVRFPQYILNMKDLTETQQLNLKPLKPYSLLMTLGGHTAAVIAIEIYDGQIVSASGDRSIKIWDVRTGDCIKTLTGHRKGVTCVQVDGRHIVSGSADETVRIFDRATGTEVACLQGHTNLVRTVQASFGGPPGIEEELEAEATAVNEKFLNARSTGLLDSYTPSREQRRPGNRGPGDIFAFSSQLPPEGGGSRWGRIVSGSYDGSLIIWEKDLVTGKWVVDRVLQNEAVKAPGNQRPPVIHTNLRSHGPLQLETMQANLAQNGGVSRIFKLQFDSRRIICCGQYPTIIGWDFAAGDKDIIEACQFLGEES